MDDIQKGYIDYEDDGETRRMDVDDNSGVSIVDIIKGPIGDPNWMTNNNLKTLPEILQDLFRSRCRQEVVDSVLRENGKESVDDIPTEELNKMIKQHVQENDCPLPTIYVHYNSRWGNRNKPGKFAIELDWSGEDSETHPGIPAGKNVKRGTKTIS